MTEGLPPPDRFRPKLPVGGEFDRWLTVGFTRTVLVVVRTVTAGTRLLDVLSLFEDDHRIQVVFTRDEDNSAVFGSGVRDFLHELGVVVLPWEQAVGTRFDLVLAASENDRLQLLDGPGILFPHGIGFQKYYPGTTVVAGLHPERLRGWDHTIALSHHDQLEELRRIGPDVARRAEVVGDPCLDRLLADAHRFEAFREAFGSTDRPLLTVVSTWGPDSLLGTDPGLLTELLARLPVDEFAVCAALHPGITSAHGPWQLRAWLATARAAGLRLVTPAAGWQAALIAASCVLADEGSLALYAAALDRPLLLAGRPAASTVPGSPMAALAERAPRLEPDRPLLAQLRRAMDEHRPGRYRNVVEAAVAGSSATALRELLYRRLRLTEPGHEAEFAPLPVPDPPPAPVSAFVIGACPHGDTVELTRFPATDTEHRLEYRHLAAHATRASLRQLSGAAIVFTELREPEPFSEWAEAVLRRWPAAHVAAARISDTVCLTRDRAGEERELSLRADPLLAASLVYLGGAATTRAIAIGERTVRVTSRVR